MPVVTRTAKKTTPKATRVFTAEERDAMEERAAEMKRGKGSKADGEADVLAKIAEMDPSDRAMAEPIHSIVKTAAPELAAKTWYGMPAYARNDKIVCFFQPAKRFKTRYATLGFSDVAKLDDGNVWANAFAVTKLTVADEKQIAALVKRAVGG